MDPWWLALGLVLLAWMTPSVLQGWNLRSDALRRWSRRLLECLAIRLHATAPRELPERCLMVANHISWVDIFAIQALHPAVFVAKAEIRRWPLVGRLCAGAGTIFIERGRSAAARRVTDRLANCLQQGTTGAIFPEGTTTPGIKGTGVTTSTSTGSPSPAMVWGT